MFLATTAITSFWNINKKVVFLGQWCLIPPNEHIWKSLDCEIMPNPWRDRDAYYKAGKYTYKTYHYLLDILTDYLNSTHSTNHSKRFWQIIIGPWLLHFTEAFYDRYYCLKKALEKHPQLETILLDETSYITPKSMKDFFSSYHDDFHSLQYYSQMLRQLGVDCHSKKKTKANKKVIQHKTLKSLIKRYLFSSTKFIANKRPIVLWGVYLGYRYLIKYVISSKFTSFLVLDEDYYKNYSKVVNDKRINLSFLQSQDEFTRLIISSLPINFPTLYLEGFDDFSEKSLSQFKNTPKILMSANGWFTDERLKFLAAYWMEKGTVLCGCQHGGLYGTAKWMPPENHEIEITDRYYTWGWNRKNNKSIKVLPNPKISNLMCRKTKYDNKTYFLFVGTNHPRYLYRFFSCPVGEMFDEYFEWRNNFLKVLTQENQNRILLRLYHIDYDRCQKERILDEFPDIRFDNHKVHFLDRLDNSQITIIDHPVTTMLESLARNRPTILFWNHCNWELRDEAKPFFEELANANIWHKDPISAAQFLNGISGNPLKWWNNPQTQSARKMFINQFAYGTKDYSEIWWSEMQGILKTSCRA